MEKEYLRYKDSLIDPSLMRITRDGNILEIQGLTYRLFLFLLRQDNRVIHADELLTAVWPDVTVSQETLTQRIKLLRDALGDDSQNPSYVVTVRGAGYRLTEDVHTVSGDEVEIGENSEERTFSRKAGPIALMGIIVLIAAVVWFRSSSATPETLPAPTAIDELLTRASHYFNLGQDSDNERAVELFLEALEIDSLNARALMGLSATYSNRVARYDYAHIWADESRELALHALDITGPNSSAFEVLAFSYDVVDDFEKAIEYYEAALAIEPNRVSSLESVAHLYRQQGALSRALRYNVLANSIEPNPRFNEKQIGQILDLLGYADAAEESYKRVFRMYPGDVYGNIAYPRFLYDQNRFSEAQATIDFVRTRNISSYRLDILEAEVALSSGMKERAATLFDRAVERNPHEQVPQVMSLLFGRTRPTERQLEDTRSGLLESTMSGTAHTDTWVRLTLVSLASGLRDEAFKELGQAIEHGCICKLRRSS